MEKPLIVLTGPTAVGKTRASIGLAKAIGGEIISADSMQVYKHMDIGSAKITKAEMEGVPHHLIDILEPSQAFHVVKFKELAEESMMGIYERGHIPIIVGGTGFYIQALLYDIDFSKEEEDTTYRESLVNLEQEKGALFLHQMLASVDEQAAKDIHANNVKRVIRALEFFYQTGTKISLHNEQEHRRSSPYRSAYIVLTDDREVLYKKINARVDQMMEDGLVDEVVALKEKGYTKELVSMQGLGYKEMLAYLDETCSLEEAVNTLKRDTRHFAKRQLTWFKREREVQWLDKRTFNHDEAQLLTAILSILREREIIK